MSDLIERLKDSTFNAINGKYEIRADVFKEAIKALSPVLPGDVAEHIAHLKSWNKIRWDENGNQLGGNLNDAKTIDLLERQAREIRKLKHRPSVATFNALQEECDGRMVAIKKVQAKIKELEASNRDKAQLLASFRSQIQALEAEPCVVNSLLSRVCERGTKCCGVYHESREE